MPIIKLKVLNKAGETLSVSDAGEDVCLVHSAAYQPGDWVSLETDTPGLHCMIQLEDSMMPACVFLPGCAMSWPIPPEDNRSNYSPKSFSGSCQLLRARLMTPQEIHTRRNLALNPYDTHGEHGLFPHAEANVETRNEAVFAARNAIDGLFMNHSHGTWPYQSWGINRDPNAALTLFFGRTVVIDELRLTLRADFPHDSWWTQATVEFSDGSREVLTLQKLAAPQAFAIQPRQVEWLILKELVKAPDPSPFPALTQLEVFGTEAADE